MATATGSIRSSGNQPWRPLAAILSRIEVARNKTTTPSTTTTTITTTADNSSSSNKSTISTTSTTTFEPITFVAANQNVWHQIVLHSLEVTSSTDVSDAANTTNITNVVVYTTSAAAAVTTTTSVASSTAATTILQGNNHIVYELDATTVEVLRMTGTAVILALLILATVIGNMFVIAAILLERNLQNVANYLILSLAVADLLVACLVMPLGAVYAVNRQWSLGPELCDMWTSSDVLCCTASILHLVAIAVDRYWAVTNVDYIHRRTAKRIGMMIATVWCVSFLVCIAPLLGWKDAFWERRVLIERQCLVSQDIGYQIFATASSFYLPLFAILVLYWRIYQTARKRIRRRHDVVTRGIYAAGVTPSTSSRNPDAGSAGTSRGGGFVTAVVAIIGRPLPTISEATTTTTTTTTAFTAISSTNTSPEKTSFANGLEVTDCGPSIVYREQHSKYDADDDEDEDESDDDDDDGGNDYVQYFPPAPPLSLRPRKQAVDSKRERKAAKTLAIITGAFVVCWLPFFIIAILLPIYQRWPWSEFMVAFFLWLGYFNSTLNPIIYTVFSPEFRQAFQKLLCGRTLHAKRLRKQQQQQQLKQQPFRKRNQQQQHQHNNKKRKRQLDIRQFR